MNTHSTPSRLAQRRIIRIEAPAARSCAYSAAFDVISKHSCEGQAAIGVLFVDGRYPWMFTEKQSARPCRETEEATRKSRAEDDFSAAVSSG